MSGAATATEQKITVQYRETGESNLDKAIKGFSQPYLHVDFSGLNNHQLGLLKQTLELKSGRVIGNAGIPGVGISYSGYLPTNKMQALESALSEFESQGAALEMKYRDKSAEPITAKTLSERISGLAASEERAWDAPRGREVD